MTGRYALKDKQKRVCLAIEKESREEFSILTGDITPHPLTLVLIGCVPAVYGDWLKTLEKLLVKDTHLSLHLAGGVCNIQFILRGTLPNPLWVSTNLLEKADEKSDQVGIYAVDLKPVRFRWFDEPHGDGPIRIETVRGRDLASKSVAEGGRWIDAPLEGKAFYLFFASLAAPVAIIEKARQSDKPLIRDLFKVEPTLQRTREGQPLKPYGVFETQFVAPQAVGLVEVSDEYLKLRNSQAGVKAATTPYRFLTEWRVAFHEETKASASVEIIPLEAVRDAADFVDNPNVVWRERLDGEKVKKRLRVGWIGAPEASAATAELEFEVERMTTVVLGESRTGKSIVAYHLLARYLKLEDDFTIVVWNCKNGKQPAGKEIQKENQSLSDESTQSRPGFPFGLLDFSAVVGEVTQKAVIAARPSELLAAFAKHGAGRAYYTEIDPNDAASVAVCKTLGAKIGAKFVFCFDEIVNRDAHDNLMQYMGHIVKEGGENDYYIMFVHQVMRELFLNEANFLDDDEKRHEDLRSKWPGIPNAACFFLKTLESVDRPLYEKYCLTKTASSVDNFVRPFEKMEHSEIVVLQPFRRSKVTPIPVSVPLYTLPTDAEQKQLKDSVCWGEVEYRELLRRA